MPPLRHKTRIAASSSIVLAMSSPNSVNASAISSRPPAIPAAVVTSASDIALAASSASLETKSKSLSLCCAAVSAPVEKSDASATLEMSIPMLGTGRQKPGRKHQMTGPKGRPGRATWRRAQWRQSNVGLASWPPKKGCAAFRCRPASTYRALPEREANEFWLLCSRRAVRAANGPVRPTGADRAPVKPILTYP